MHPLQVKILKSLSQSPKKEIAFAKIGELIKEGHHQKIKHHLEQLEKKGFVVINRTNRTVRKIERGADQNNNLISIPILGMANCGSATIFAEENYLGFLKVTKGMLGEIKNTFFALKTVGKSMNRANIKDQQIEEGDYVIVDSENKDASDGDYVLSIIDGCANIKKLIKDRKNKQIVLVSESTQDYPPIYIDEQDDYKYLIGGKVVRIIKNVK